MGVSVKRIRKDGKTVREEAENGVLRNSRRRQENMRRGAGRVMTNNVGGGEMFPTLKIQSKIKTFHTINKANCISW